MPKSKRTLGLWLIGACGGVGSTVALGLSALRKSRESQAGLVTSLPLFDGLDLVGFDSIVLGGHEIRSESLGEAVRSMHKGAGVFDAELIRSCERDFASMQKNIRTGTLSGARDVVSALADRNIPPDERSPMDVIDRLKADIEDFRRRHRLSDVVVIHVASSEPAVKILPVHRKYALLKRQLQRRGASPLPSSSMYALAALEAGCPFVNFTPSPGISLPAIQERANQLGLPFMGNDGKTGETLVKSILAPMFAMRNLKVLSWVGQNILGNRDGAVLNDPKTRESKIKSKDRILGRVLGEDVTTKVSIDYVPSLDDWKVAWDFIHFEGFLGTRMNMQFTWCGCDSLLAAPLIIDLARLAEWEHRRGGTGPMSHLGFFFKDPIGDVELDLFSQWLALVEHVARADSDT